MSVELAAPRNHAAHAFAAMAPYYDAFTSHHDYELWWSGLERLLPTPLAQGSPVLDLACGTGKSCEPLLRRGLRVTACDGSAEMLSQARHKLGDHVDLHLADVRALPVLGRFALITCLDDITNYLLDAEELVALFEGIARNLAPDGVAVLDANTLWTFRSFFGATIALDGGDHFMSWRGECPADAPAGVLAEAALDIFVRTGTGRWTRRVSRHFERHHSVETITAAVQSAGLEMVLVRGMFPDVSFEAELDEERHNKAIYLVTRPR
jgi:SAM-dependent methyltransferase